MPDHGEFQNNASPNNLEESIWRLKVGDNNGEDLDVHQQNLYPDRPGATDCIYYLRTGLCGYGNNCRYNHPSYNVQGTRDRVELSERVGQPECQYFLKTGTCKFGATCKYHHPRCRTDAPPAPLNMLGLPMRQDEKSCPYYMRTGSCKFGIACKFNHPQPATLGSSAYGFAGSSVAPQSSHPFIGGLSAWPLARPYLPSSGMQGLPVYMPVVLPSSQGAMPMQQGWTSYTIPNTKLLANSGSSTTINLPERPRQPGCQYYMKTGSCKYGTTCKYHHPKERYWESPFTLGPLGLPLRPGHAACISYTTYGNCKYGSSCKYDHPVMGFYNYAVPALPVSDPSYLFPPNQMNLPQATSNTESNTDSNNNNERTDVQQNKQEQSD